MAASPAPARDPIWTEDEVWQEAFETRVPSRGRRRSSPHPPARDRYPITGRERPTHVDPAPPPVPAARLAEAVPERRTVTIKGRGAERNLPWPGDAPARRPARPLHERAGFRPDRLAMWAVFLGLLLVLVAALSAH